MENYIPQGNAQPPVEPRKFCGNCGNELNATAAFCPKCGAPVVSAPSTPVAEPFAAPTSDPAAQTEPAFSAPAADPTAMPGFDQAFATQKPQKKSKKGLVIGIIVGVLVVALIALGVLIAVGASGGASSSAGDVVVGTWDGVMAYVDDEEIYVPDGFATAYLYSDHTGTVYVDTDDIEFTWEYDKTDDEGDMIYTLSYESLDVAAFLYDPVSENLVIAFDDSLIIVFERE